MSEGPDKESQTEAPSQKKLDDAQEQGNIPVSREAGSFAALAAMMAVASFLLMDGVRNLHQRLAQVLDNPAGWSLKTGGDATQFLTMIGIEMARFILPVFIMFMGAGLAVSFAQNIPQFVLDRIQPKMSRISLAKGWSRLFGAQGWMEFLKVLAKFTAIVLVIVLLLRSEQTAFVDVMFLPPGDVPQALLQMILHLISPMMIAIGVIAAIDVITVRIQWYGNLRMSRQELKDEHKQSEGDPLVKSRLRSLALDRSRRRMLDAVPNATMVIANPTHYAIALRYVKSENAAPVVVAKGQDLIALKIREIAEKNGIPVIEDKALARSMYDQVEVDRMIPAAFYRAVAELIHYLTSRKSVPMSGSRH